MGNAATQRTVRPESPVKNEDHMRFEVFGGPSVWLTNTKRRMPCRIAVSKIILTWFSGTRQTVILNMLTVIFHSWAIDPPPVLIKMEHLC